MLNAGAIGKTLPFFGPRDTIQSHTSTSSFVATRRCFLDDGVNGFDERHCFRKQCRPPLPSSRDASKSTLGGILILRLGAGGSAGGTDGG